MADFSIAVGKVADVAVGVSLECGDGSEDGYHRDGSDLPHYHLFARFLSRYSNCFGGLVAGSDLQLVVANILVIGDRPSDDSAVAIEVRSAFGDDCLHER